jgi:Tfp pilus assembly protein PilF
MMPVVLVVAGCAVYANSLTGPFIFDDHHAIPENPHVRSLWPIWNAWQAPDQSTLDGRPLVSLSFALNYALSGYDVRGYHIVNLLVHILNALLVFGIVRRTLSKPQAGSHNAASAQLLAFGTALLWLVHPLLTEPVNYLVQRTELMVGCFLLLTLYAFIRGCDATRPGRWHVVSVIACALGVGCKEMIVVAPVLVLVYDHIFVSGSIRVALRQRKRLYAGLVGTWFLLAALIALGPRADTVATAHGEITPWTYLLTQAGVIVHYLRLSLWPVPLGIDYDDWPIAQGIIDVWLPGLVVLGLLALTAWSIRTRSGWGFAGAWFFLILAPTSSVVPIVTEVAAERRMYLPLAAVVFAVLWVVRRVTRPLPRWIGVAVITALTAGAAAGTIHRNRDYQSEIRIYEQTIAVRPGNVRARGNLGAALVKAGRLAEGKQRLQETLALRPGYADAHYLLGVTLAMEGEDAAAEKHLAGVLQVDDTNGPAHYTLGTVLSRQRRYPEAAHHFARAAQLLPDPAEAVLGLGTALANMGQLDKAIPLFQKALELRPSYAEARAHLDRALSESQSIPSPHLPDSSRTNNRPN